MGAQFSGIESLKKKNVYLDRLCEEENIDENDPFWNQLLSFTFNVPLSKSNSKLLDESVALLCQKLHQNNLKSGNYSSLIRVFCRRSAETKQMSDDPLMVLQTTNALLLIRCFTKYIVEIENENALLEQLNVKAYDFSSSSDLKADGLSTTPRHSSESPVNSPRLKSASHNRTQANKSKSQDGSVKENSSENSVVENDSDLESSTANSFIIKNNDENHVMYQLIKSIFELCIEIPVQPHTYYLHLEALNTLIVLLSIQMYTKTPTHESNVYETFMHKLNVYVSEFVKYLLKNLIQQMPNPPYQSVSLDPNGQQSAQRSMFSSMASGLWTVMTLGLASSSSNSSSPVASASNKNELITYLPSLPSDSTSGNGKEDSILNDMQINCSERLLAWQSCHILLILSNHCTNESLYNPYRLALFHFTDTQDTPTNLPNSEPLHWFSIDYTKLFQMFTFTLHSDQYTLLLYMLLHRNQHFKMFILSRLNIDFLVIPILKVIYSAPERNSHHIYMALIILLILSEDDIFNKTIHNIPVKRLTWYTERNLSEISLGSLLILVVIRTIQFNITRMRDKYLHTNCLAALANMSSKFQNLHPYVCQRINSLFNLLSKKRAKIINLINNEENNGENEDQQQTQSDEKDMLQDLAIIEELMRMVLEIINSCLTNNMHHNSSLIYSMLYHKTNYTAFFEHPNFQDIIQNINVILTSFSHDIEALHDKSIERINEVIELGVKQFSRDRFKKFPELKFKYVEEDQPEEFFVPYVWSLVYKYSNLYWIEHSVGLNKNATTSSIANASS